MVQEASCGLLPTRSNSLGTIVLLEGGGVGTLEFVGQARIHAGQVGAADSLVAGEGPSTPLALTQAVAGPRRSSCGAFLAADIIHDYCG